MDYLFDHSIFDNSVADGKDRKVRVLFAGMSARSEELLCTMLWLGQMPGYRFEYKVVCVTDFIPGFRERYPGLPLLVDEEGLARYSIDFVEAEEYGTSELYEAVGKCCDFSYAFVDTGDERRDADIAKLLRDRRECAAGDYAIEVLSGWTEVGKVPCRELDQRAESRLETAARLIYEEHQKSRGAEPQAAESGEHQKSRGAEPQAAESGEHQKSRGAERAAACREIEDGRGRTAWEELGDYDKKASLARALAVKYKMAVIDSDFDADYSLLNTSEVWKKYEHMRWVAYTWTCGFVLGDEVSRARRTHTDLVNYDLLSRENQGTDAIEVNEKIAALLAAK